MYPLEVTQLAYRLNTEMALFAKKRLEMLFKRSRTKFYSQTRIVISGCCYL